MLRDDVQVAVLRKTPGMTAEFLDIVHFCACMANEAMGWPQPARAMVDTWTLSGRAQRLQVCQWPVLVARMLSQAGSCPANDICFSPH